MPEDERQHTESDRRPIKVILPNQGKERAVPGGGPLPTPFRPVTQEYRSRLRTQVDAIAEAIQPQVGRTKAAPIRVKLLPEAAAKSHRPERLFTPETTPIIGAGHLGELFLMATPSGLEELGRTISRNKTDRIIKELSSVEAIEPITPQFRRRGRSALDVLRASPRGPSGFITRVRLFDFGRRREQELLVADFKHTCQRRDLAVESRGYSPKSFLYAVECRSADDVEALSRTVGVRSVSQMPVIQTVRPLLFNPQPLPNGLPLPRDFEGDWPVVVVVDSGVDDSMLGDWIVGRDSYVSPQYRNHDHGTFVAGLIAWGGHFNPKLPDVDLSPCGVMDLEVLPNSDPGKGDVEVLTESAFLQTLETALQRYANLYKVWNLSLGNDEVCSLDEFSSMAEQLDNLQEKYQISMVISAGNYTSPPLLDYPRTGAQLAAGRITSPADSVLGTTVGSISHIGYSGSGPKQHDPSAFSRHGAGPNYIIKPDLVHYGGACSTDAKLLTGIKSVNGGACAENLGTSFAAPLVSRALAHVYHQITPTPSPVVARALLTHHARDPRTGGRVPDGEENYFGFGRPAPPPYCLECTPYSSTLIFEDTLRPGYFLEWDSFPYPPSLVRRGRYHGEIWMTVAFSPARGSRWGTEYCETHIDAHFGVYVDRKNRKTGQVVEQFEGLVPPEHKNPGILYESYQVRELRKWAPVRTYHGYLGARGERGKRWRLMVRLLTRHGVEGEEAFKPQPFSLVITIADPERKAQVYDEMAQIIRTRFRANNLVVRAAARVRARG